MESLELLVKLASFGTAGVCVLAVFIVGKYTLALPKDSPSWKVSLMRRYQNMCIIVAIISLFAGGITAYFNQNKINTANQQAVEANQSVINIQDQYKKEEQKVDSFKVSFTSQLQHLQTQILLSPGVPSATRNSITNLTAQARLLKIMPVDDLQKKSKISRVLMNQKNK